MKTNHDGITVGSITLPYSINRRGRINTASIDRFNNDFEPLSHEEAQQIKADLEQSEHIKKLRSQRAA
ncbi:TPA: DUF1317 family protein [Klebsiella pneumoniae]|nr:DUF1317 family protein [Klebsiella pneumoniae]